MKEQNIYQYASSYDKIKSRCIIDALYTDFMPWEQLLDFEPSIRAPNGNSLCFESDPAMIIGTARFQGEDVALIAQQTPLTAQDRNAYNYGLVQADGYGLALCMMRYAEQYGLPLHTFIDTVGGDPFERSAAKLQSWLIARCQARMLSLNTRSISTIIGQGGSGGAIALQLGHRRLMLALSMYAVIAPEGCAAILFRNVEDKTIAAAIETLQPTAKHMLKYGIIDEIVPEPFPGEPGYLDQTLRHLQRALAKATEELADQPLEDLQVDLRDRLAHCGRIAESKPWHKRARRITQRSRNLTAPSSATTDPHIASIKRHVFGNSDCVPQACNTVRDQDGQIIRSGCGHVFSEEAFRANWQACPNCHLPSPLDPILYADLLLEADSFREIYAHIKLEHIDDWTSLHNHDISRQKAEKRTPGKEALMIGHGAMFGDLHVAVALSNFAYMGGSMGAVVGEKFRIITQFACDHHLPLISVATTGGARMQEGTLALAQMAKTTAAVISLREAGLPFISVLGHPTVGGVLASYATLGDFIIAEEKATLSFAGDRVVKLTSGGRGIAPESMTAEFFARHGGIQAVVKRQDMKALIAGLLRLTPWYREAKLAYDL